MRFYRRQYLPLSERRADERKLCIQVAVVGAFVISALLYAHITMVMPMLNAFIPTAYAGEPCENVERYSNYQQAKEWCDL